MEIQTLSRNLTNERIDMPYPNLQVLNPSPAFATVFKSLPKGDLSVLFEKDGKLLRPGSIQRSALVLLPLIKVAEIVYNLDAETQIPLRTGADIIEVLAG